jgi:aminoglycoside phosphotransferase (APT) family kinase protein
VTIEAPGPDHWQSLADSFGLGPIRETPSYVARGAMGETWRLVTSAGHWAVKWQFRWAPADPCPADVAIQLAASDAGIPLPRPITAADGAAVVQIGDRYARVYQWVDLGRPVTPPAAAGIAAEAGRLLGMLHALALPADGPVDPWFTVAPSLADWADIAERSAAVHATWAPGLAAARGLIAELSEAAAPSRGTPVSCHRDFNPDNIIPAMRGGLLTVLDWENAGPLDPLRELGYAIFAWSTGGGSFSPAAADALLAAYANATGEAPELGPDLYATAVAVHLNFLAAMASTALTEPDHRSYAEDALAGLLEHDLRDLQRLIERGPESLGG